MKFYRLHAPMPILTEDGYRVVFHKITSIDNVSLKDVVRLLLMFGEKNIQYQIWYNENAIFICYLYWLADLRMEEENAIAGDIYVFDAKDLKIPFLMKFISPLTKKILEIIQYAYPQRLKQIHVINAPTVIYSTVKFIKSFMKEKMRNRVSQCINTLFINRLIKNTWFSISVCYSYFRWHNPWLYLFISTAVRLWWWSVKHQRIECCVGW